MPSNVVTLIQSNNAPTRALQSSAVSLEAWVLGWWPEFDQSRFQTVPERIIPLIPEALDRARRLCPSASIEFFALQMARLTNFVMTFGLAKMDVENATAIYHETLGDLPEDLLERAISETIRDHKYQNMPKPGDIRSRVGEAFQVRCKPLRKLEMAQRAIEQSQTRSS